jgi:hypothetical protein
MNIPIIGLPKSETNDYVQFSAFKAFSPNIYFWLSEPFRDVRIGMIIAIQLDLFFPSCVLGAIQVTTADSLTLDQSCI